MHINYCFDINWRNTILIKISGINVILCDFNPGEESNRYYLTKNKMFISDQWKSTGIN